MHISAVIPTCDRKSRLLSLLHNLDRSSYPLAEVIVVDSGTDRLSPAEYSGFTNLTIKYIRAERSVCIQRNKGISVASSPWILLCDDDVELPVDYLEKLVDHINKLKDVGAVSGLWLERNNNEWTASHPVRSKGELFRKYLFQLGIWGEIICKDNSFTRPLKRYYEAKGNHVSKAGWPVNTNFNGSNIVFPVYSLGATLVRKDWLIHSPFDEVLDPHGIGENYGVALGFPIPGVHVIKASAVKHHLDDRNRLQRALQYYRRVLALDYFRRIKKIEGIKKRWLVWSLIGNLAGFVLSGNGIMIRAGFKSVVKVLLDQNPYYIASKQNRKTVEPRL